MIVVWKILLIIYNFISSLYCKEHDIFPIATLNIFSWRDKDILVLSFISMYQNVSMDSLVVEHKSFK